MGMLGKGMIGKLVKTGVLVKGVQLAQRELRKPENQKKLNDALAKLKQRRGPARP
jgi:hypothetical protein